MITLDPLLSLLTDPMVWVLGVQTLLMGLSFAYSVVFRRSPPVLLLLALGAMVGLAATVIAWPDHFDPYKAAAFGLVCTAVAWTFLAAPVALSAVIQPGGPAPLRPGRLARHFVPAVGGALALLYFDPTIAWVAMAVLVVSLAAGREGERVVAAWSIGTVMLACSAALLGTSTLLASIFDSDELSVLLLEIWVGTQAAAAGLELALQGRAPWRWVPVVALLALSSAVFEGKRQATDIAVLWHSLGRSLPRCPIGPSAPLPRGPRVVPASAPAQRGEIVVAGSQEDVGPHLGQMSGVPCASLGHRRYGFIFISDGVGVEVRHSEGQLRLASGGQLIDTQVVPALLACGYAGQAIALSREDAWPAGMVVSTCHHEGRCVAADEVCTHDRERGWYVRR